MTERLALVVEDDRDSARLYTRIVEPLGFKSEIASDKEAALDRLDATTPDLVLLDLSLVRRKLDTSGMEILAKLRSEKRFDNTRVIIISAYSKLIDEVKHEVDGAIIKPIKAKTLANLVESLSFA